MKYLSEKIAEKKSFAAALEQEIRHLEELERTASKQDGIENWLDYPFETSSGLTEEFAAFAKDFKKSLINELAGDFELVVYSRGHFEVDCFIKNAVTGKFVNLFISDVRHWPNDWYENVVVRTAENEKDYKGGPNNSCRLPDIREHLIELTK